MKLPHLVILCSCSVLLTVLAGCSSGQLHYAKQYYSPTVAREHTDLRNALNNYTYTGYKNCRLLGTHNFNIDTLDGHSKSGLPFELYNDRLRVLKDSFTGLGPLGSSNNVHQSIYETNDTDKDGHVLYVLTKGTLVLRRSMPGGYNTLDYVKYRLHDVQYGEYTGQSERPSRLKKFILYPEIVKRSGKTEEHLSTQTRKHYPLVLIRNKRINDSNYKTYHSHVKHTNTVP